MTSNSTQHVLIIGAGLAGPCLALALARHGIHSTIFEIRTSRSESGGSISLQPNALRVLDKLAGVYDKVLENGFAYSKMTAYGEDGGKLGDIKVGEDDGYPAVRILRTRLNEILLTASEEGGLTEVKWGYAVSRIEEDEKGIRAYFEDGSIAKGDILIGSDGIHSKVRQHVLGAEAPIAKYTGVTVVNGIVPKSSVKLPTPDYTFPAVVPTAYGIFMAVPIDAEGKSLAWGITTLTGMDRTREEWKELERSGEASRLAKTEFEGVQSQPVRSLLDHADDKKAKIWTPYSLPDLPTWHTGRVCLIGDAAHGLPPNGQGSAMAFEDAAILTMVLTRSKNAGLTHDQIFEEFERIRKPRIEAVKQKSGKTEALKSKTGPWIWMVKMFVIRSMFWWKSGVLQFGMEPALELDDKEKDDE